MLYRKFKKSIDMCKSIDEYTDTEITKESHIKKNRWFILYEIQKITNYILCG